MSGSSARTTGDAVVIAPDASCAAVARRHVTSVLRALGRPDLVDTARLAVTELATNAALHARTPVTVTVRELPGDGVRIEVADGSAVMPAGHLTRPTSTVGRGLHVVESLGSWGVEPVVHEGRTVGKVVWFCPGQDGDGEEGDGPQGDGQQRESRHGEAAGPAATRTPTAADRAGDARGVLGRYAGSSRSPGLVADAVPTELTAPDAVPTDPTTADGLPAGAPRARRATSSGTVTVQLLNFPLRVFADAREHHDELIRELALLSLQRNTPGSAGTSLPARLAELVDLLGRRYGAAAERGDAIRDAALARGELSADLRYQVRVEAVDELVRLTALLAEVEEFCREGWLLTLQATDVQRAFVRWYRSEFVRQRDGLPPTPWNGPLTPDEPFPGTPA